jgi:hypothetical protein
VVKRSALQMLFCGRDLEGCQSSCASVGESASDVDFAFLAALILGWSCENIIATHLSLICHVVKGLGLDYRHF